MAKSNVATGSGRALLCALALCPAPVWAQETLTVTLNGALHSTLDVTQIGASRVAIRQTEATDSDIAITAIGPGLTVTTGQTGDRNRQSLLLGGQDFSLETTQTGADNLTTVTASDVARGSASLRQTGIGHRAELALSGAEALVAIQQGLAGGHYDTAIITQTGASHDLSLQQSGGGNHADLTQTGEHNSMAVLQEHGNNSLNALQSGGQSATIEQYGGRSLILHQSVPGIVIVQP
jgi:hypothetical protein